MVTHSRHASWWFPLDYVGLVSGARARLGLLLKLMAHTLAYGIQIDVCYILPIIMRFVLESIASTHDSGAWRPIATNCSLETNCVKLQPRGFEPATLDFATNPIPDVTGGRIVVSRCGSQKDQLMTWHTKEAHKYPLVLTPMAYRSTSVTDSHILKLLIWQAYWC